MVVIFNLNKYIGGGEVLAMRFAEFLQKNSIDYVLFSFDDKNCYIKNQAILKQLNLILWPSTNDSVAYMNSREKTEALSKIEQLFPREKLYIFTFCFRDLYNSLYFFSRLKHKRIQYSTGIYHPEDIFYLSSLSFNKKRIIDFNRSLAYELAKKNAIVFANETARVTTYDSQTYPAGGSIIPIPIDINGPVQAKQSLNQDKIRIVSISRFVEFKIGAVFAIVKFIRRNPNIHLDLIGYGSFEILLRAYIAIYNIKNITLHGKVEPAELYKIINQASIGYAQGTSIMEIAKYGIPVVIAPYSRIKDIFNHNFKCMGIFGEKDNLNYGDIKDDGSDSFVSLNETIFKVIGNYSLYATKSVNHLRNFASDKIFSDIASLVKSSDYRQEIAFDPISPPYIKRILKRIFK